MDVGRSDCIAVVCGWEATVHMPEEVVRTSGDLCTEVCLDVCMSGELSGCRKEGRLDT